MRLKPLTLFEDRNGALKTFPIDSPDETDSFELQLRNFVDAINGRGRAINDARQALQFNGNAGCDLFLQRFGSGSGDRLTRQNFGAHTAVGAPSHESLVNKPTMKKLIISLPAVAVLALVFASCSSTPSSTTTTTSSRESVATAPSTGSTSTTVSSTGR